MSSTFGGQEAVKFAEGQNCEGEGKDLHYCHGERRLVDPPLFLLSLRQHSVAQVASMGLDVAC